MRSLRPSRPPRPVAPRRGYTLVELLVVIGVMVLLAGVGAMALAGRGSSGAALSGAQSIVAGMIASTRAQAALHQTKARLIIHAQQPPAANAADAEMYLRRLQVVREESRNVWVAVGPPVSLPTPICVVPPAPVPTNHLRSGVSWDNNVGTGPVSTLSTATGFSYFGQSGNNTRQFFDRQGQSGRIFFLDFGPDGTVVSTNSGTPTKIALTTAVLGGNTLPAFESDRNVRGVLVRRNGAVSMVDSKTGF